MSTLAEIEKAVDSLSESEQQDLLRYLHARLQPRKRGNADGQFLELAGTIRLHVDPLGWQQQVRSEWP